MAHLEVSKFLVGTIQQRMVPNLNTDKAYFKLGVEWISNWIFLIHIWKKGTKLHWSLIAITLKIKLSYDIELQF